MKHFLSFLLFFILLNPLKLSANSSVVQNQNSDILSYNITANRLEKSRNNLSAKTGQSSYSFSQKDIDNLPQGQATSLNQVLLRAPGVTQNSYGQIHIRGDHSNVQYRINDVMIPQGISGFGQAFDTHFAQSIDLLRGALPAQYGYRTAGVVDIKTKGGKFDKSARSELMFGGNQTIGVNQQISGSKDRLNYYLSASYLSNNRGIEPPTSARNPIHDDTRQDKLFGHFSYLIDAQKKLSFIIANSNNRFQIPNNPNQVAEYELAGVDPIASSDLRQRQRESNRYAILALQGVTDSEVDYQLSLFSRYSKNIFNADRNGDLMFSGIAANTNRSSFSNGFQGDFSYKLNEKNTLRSGLFFSDEKVLSKKDSEVFPLDVDDEPLTTTMNINTSSNQNTQLYGIYLQDEYKPIEKLTLNFGARFDAMQSNSNENQLSPRFGATYDFSERTKVHAGYARYFSPPKTELLSVSTVARYVGTSAGSASLLNDKVKAERSNYYDIGVAHKVGKHLNLSLDAYYKETKNFLDEGQFSNALIYTPFNFREGKSYGIEFGADYRKENLAAFFNFAAQKTKARKIISSQYLFDAEELENNEFANIDHDQSYTASAGVSYLFKGTNFALDALYGSGLAREVGHMPSYFQANFSVARDLNLPIIEKVNLKFATINLFDQTYQLRDGTGIGVAASQYGPRRTFYLIATKLF